MPRTGVGEVAAAPGVTVPFVAVERWLLCVRVLFQFQLNLGLAGGGMHKECLTIFGTYWPNITSF